MRGRVAPYKRVGNRVVAWRVFLELGIGVDGERQRWTQVVNGTRAEAEALRARKEAEVLAGTFVPRHVVTVKEWLEVWLEDYAPLRASVGTVEGYKRTCEAHIIPALGSLRLSELLPEVVQKFYRRQKDQGLAPRTILHQHRILSAALKRAVRVGRLAWNPLDRVDAPTAEAHEPKALDVAGGVELLGKLEGSELYVPALLALRCGLRRGEMLALRWQDVDLKECRLRVERACDPAKANRGAYKAPKSKAGRRVVPFSPDVQDVLKAHQRAQKERKLRLGIAYQDNGLVVCRDDGQPWDPSRFSNAWTKAKVDKKLAASYHELRHSFCSQLARSGVPIGSAQALMGHADAVTTQRVYTHILDGQLEDAVALLYASVQAATPAKEAGEV